MADTALDGTQQGAAVTAATAALSGEGQGAHWSEALPEEYRESLKGFDSPDAFKAALVQPVIPEVYKVPEGVSIDQETFDAFAPLAKELGLTQEKVEKLLAFDSERAASLPQKLMAQVDAQNKAELATMAKELGAEKYEGALKAANIALTTFAGKEDIQWLKDAGLANNPRLVKIFANIGVNLQEDTPPGGSGAGGERAERTLADLYKK